jgi:hypothetical protein
MIILRPVYKKPFCEILSGLSSCQLNNFLVCREGGEPIPYQLNNFLVCREGGKDKPFPSMMKGRIHPISAKPYPSLQGGRENLSLIS